MLSTATQPAATQPAVKHRPYGNPAIDDAQLIAAAIDRQAWAWPAIVQRYDGLVLSVTWSYRLSAADTAEVLQEVWARLLENLRQIRRPERVAGWISRVTRNECLRLIRRNAREIPTEDDLERGLGNDDDLDTHMLAGERQVALRRAMVGLPERGRALLEALLDQPSLSHRELAVKLDMPLGSVGPTRQRCLTKLRSSMALAVLA
jgi:RNA polymerase sigma factor (sigma-70 family)